MKNNGEKIWKRGNHCLIFAPAKTERGRRDEGTASSRGGGVLAMLTTIFPGGPFKRGREKKKFEKTLKKFLTRTKRYGNILNVLDENKEVNNAGVAELADARDLKCRG